SELSIATKRESLTKSRYYKKDVITNTFTEDDYINILEREGQYSRYREILRKYRLSDDKDYLSLLHETKERIRNSNTDFYPLLKRKEELRKKIAIEILPPERVYTLDDLLKAREYEANIRHNAPLLREIEKYSLPLSMSEMENIVANENNYSLLSLKKS